MSGGSHENGANEKYKIRNLECPFSAHDLGSCQFVSQWFANHIFPGFHTQKTKYCAEESRGLECRGDIAGYIVGI